MKKDNTQYQIQEEEIKQYFYERNIQLYKVLQNGMSYLDASDLFGLSKNTIKNMYKKYRHTYHAYKQLSIGATGV